MVRAARALANASGTITDTYDFTAFGELFSSTGSTTNSYLYTGQQFDSLTGLYSLHARYYNPFVGRLLSRDTFPVNFRNPIELNRYGYTANNPVNRFDPSGLTFLGFGKTIHQALFSGGRGAVTGFVAGTGLAFGREFASSYYCNQGSDFGSVALTIGLSTGAGYVLGQTGRSQRMRDERG